MGDEVIKLLLQFDVEVDEKGKIKKATKDLEKLQELRKQLASEKSQNISLRKAFGSSDKKEIEELTKIIDSYAKAIRKVDYQIKNLKSVPVEKLDVSKEDMKNANNIGKSLSIPSSAKLIQESFLTNAKGEQTWVGIFQQYVEEDGKRLVKTYKQIGDEVRVETNKLRKGLVESSLPKADIKGELFKAKVNPENNDFIQWTKELNGNLQITRKYINGVLVETQELIKAEKKTKPEPKPEIKPESLPTPKKNSFDKFIARVKNIVVYRLVREVMSAVSKSITEGFNLVSINNSSAKNVLTEFKATSISLSTSLASLLLPIMQSLSSLLDSVGNKFIDVANKMSRQNAIAKGQATYFKLNKEAIDDYAKSLTNVNGNLSQLDKFATLSGNNTPILGDFVSVSEDVKEAKIEFDAFSSAIEIVSNVLSKLGELLDFVSKNFGVILNLVLILSGAKGIMELTNLFGGLNTTLSKAVASVSLLLAGFSIISAAIHNDYSPAIKALMGALGGLIMSLGVVVALKEVLTKGQIAGIISLSAILGAATAFSSSLANVADSGSSSVDLSSATDISSLMGGVASSGSYSQSVSVTGGSNLIQGDVILDGYKVGNILSQRINTNFNKAGYVKGR